LNETNDTAVQARRREIATEHVLFWLIKNLAERDPDLIASIEASLDHLGDPAQDGTKDDEAVREIARRMLRGARSAG
jgi:plasmid stabilization system protein ParE